jgi:DNA-binding CsgD family transcriptional regulator
MAAVVSDFVRKYIRILILESQVRRHKAPRSLSDRCRMVLLCAQGLQSKAVAERLGVHEHTVGKWRRGSYKMVSKG